MKKVSFVVINYNSSQYTLNCLDSIFEQTAPSLSFEVVIVDNNSQFDDYKRLADSIKHNEIKLVRSRINLGFSGGNMLGVQYSNAQYLFFLNNDCELKNDVASLLAKFMDSTPDAGICTAQMYNSDGSFEGSFGYFPNLWVKILGPSILRLFSAARYPKAKVKYSDPLKVHFVTGAAMFVDFAKFSDISGLDTNYFLYCEEEDIAKNMAKRGFLSYLVPEAEFIHHSGKSTVRNYKIEREFYISLMYYLRKHHSYIEYSMLRVVYFFKVFKKIFRSLDYLKLAFFVLRGAPMKYSLRFSQKIGASSSLCS